MKKIVSGICMLMALTICVGGSTFAQSGEVSTTPLDTSSVSAGLTPASPFYFLDRFGEFLQELFTFSPEAKIKLKIEFAKERIVEIKIMLEDESSSTGDIEEAQSLLVNHIEDAQNIVDEEKIDDKNSLELTSLLDDEIDDEDNDKDAKQTFEKVKNELENGQNRIDNEDVAGFENHRQETKIEDSEDIEDNDQGIKIEDSKDNGKQDERGDHSED